jgi:hypothetical protein
MAGFLDLPQSIKRSPDVQTGPARKIVDRVITVSAATRGRLGMATSIQQDDDFYTAYPLKKRLKYVFGMILVAVLIAGFWHRGLVDGFGRNVVAGGTIGNTGDLAGQYDTHGGGFGLIFAAIAGLAATFTACNCVVFAMMPGLACSTDRNASHSSAWAALGMFTVPVLIVTAVYGLYVGFLGPVGIEYINQVQVRHAQSFAVFSALGFAMLLWGCLELGFMDSDDAGFFRSAQRQGNDSRYDGRTVYGWPALSLVPGFSRLRREYQEPGLWRAGHDDPGAGPDRADGAAVRLAR